MVWAWVELGKKKTQYSDVYGLLVGFEMITEESEANFVAIDKLVRGRWVASGQVGGWLDPLKIRINSASIKVEAELGNSNYE